MSFKTEEEKISYALGLSVGGSLKQSGLEVINGAMFMEAVETTLAGEAAKLEPQEANALLQAFFEAIQKRAKATLEKVGQDFLVKNKLNTGVVECSSGLQYKIISKGQGASPAANDRVKCHYHGTLIDGTVFDSSIDRGEPVILPVGSVIKGWAEALLLMEEGDKWQLFIPAGLAYGAQGAGERIGPYETLIFEVELLEIVKN